MLTLGINTASSYSKVALLKDDETIGQDSWRSSNDEAEKLMPKIAEMMGEFTFDDISSVVVVKGPGSFTGLRVGITVANTIAHLVNADLYAIDTFQYWWTAFSDRPESSPRGETALLIFAGKGGVYVSLKPGHIGELVDLPDLIEHLKSNNIGKIFGDISDDQKTFIASYEFEKIEPDFAKIITNVDLPEEKIVKPLYVKQPNITQQKCST